VLTGLWPAAKASLSIPLMLASDPEPGTERPPRWAALGARQPG
jgi:hypothetical protein